ncbi:MAG: hypothetical protein ABR590_06325, partial [Spirochaetia bacterium]
MNMIKRELRGAPSLLFYLMIFIVLSFSSCDLFFGSSGSSQTLQSYGSVGDHQVGFYARDLENNWRVVDSELRAYERHNAFVYVERGASLGGLEAEEILDEFGNEIRPIVANKLGEADFVNSLGVSSNDRSVVILVLDLGAPDATGAMLLGYFDPLHAYQRTSGNPYSNELPMVFLNSRLLTDFGGSFSSRVNQFHLTLAHEFQHLHNFYFNVGHQQIGQMDTWIDEMLSAAAEYYYDGVQQARIDYFTGASYGFTVKNDDDDDRPLNYNPYVAMGQNHVAWGRPWTDVLTSYASVHMKMNWLRLHAADPDLDPNGDDLEIFRDMVLSPHTNALAVSDATSDTRIRTNGWDELLRTWAAANWLRLDTELLGYKGQTPFQNGEIETLNQWLDDSNQVLSDSKYVLGPGEFIYITPDSGSSFDVAVTDSDIFYARLMSDNVEPTGTLHVNETLLAYNTHTDPSASTRQTRALPLEDSLVTSSSISSLSSTDSGSLQVTPPPGPHGIDMVFRDSGAGGVSAQG